jgi:hypothetical protein
MRNNSHNLKIYSYAYFTDRMELFNPIYKEYHPDNVYYLLLELGGYAMLQRKINMINYYDYMAHLMTYNIQ